MATESSGWNNCLSLAAQLKKQSLTTQSPANSSESQDDTASKSQALEKLRRYQAEMQNRNYSQLQLP